MSLLTLLAALFAPVVDRTGHPMFAERERASEVLAWCWPMSEPALAAGRRSPDLEVAVRCRRAAPDWWRLELEADALARRMVAGEFSDVVFRSDAVRRAFIRLARAHGIDTSVTFYFGETQFWVAPTGYDYVRGCLTRK